MDSDNDFLEPGMLVRHPDHPEWGVGQVQSNIPGRIVVTFENAGKVSLNSHKIVLELNIGSKPPLGSG